MPATTNPYRAAVLHALMKGKKAPDALDTLVNTCNAGANCSQVQNDPVAKQALGGLQASLTTSQASQTKRTKLANDFKTATRVAAADFLAVGKALTTYESAVAAIAKGDSTIISAAGCMFRDETSAHASLEIVTGVYSKLGKLACQAVVGWPAAPGARGYTVEVNWTPQNPTGPWTTLGSGTGRRWVITAPTPGAQFLARVASNGAHGEQAAFSTAILVTAR